MCFTTQTATRLQVFWDWTFFLAVRNRAEFLANRLSWFFLSVCFASPQPPTPQLPLKHVDTPVSSSSPSPPCSLPLTYPTSLWSHAFNALHSIPTFFPHPSSACTCPHGQQVGSERRCRRRRSPHQLFISCSVQKVAAICWCNPNWVPLAEITGS